MGFSINIREMRTGDESRVAAAFLAQGWNKPQSQFERYLEEQARGERRVLVAEAGEERALAGYATIIWSSEYPPFRESGIPEIVDLNVLIKYRRMKIGSALLKEAEQLIAQRSPVAGIRVGLHSDYGNAQAMYVNRGYVPDCRGISSQGSFAKHGDKVTVDDDLVLALTKDLRA